MKSTNYNYSEYVGAQSKGGIGVLFLVIEISGSLFSSRLEVSRMQFKLNLKIIFFTLTLWQTSHVLRTSHLALNVERYTPLIMSISIM